VTAEHYVTLHPDSFAFLRELRGSTFDVILTDPPYNEHVQGNLCSGSLVGTKAVPKYELDFAPVTEHSWIHDAVRSARRWVVAFCAVEEFGEYKRLAPESYVRGGVWYKSNAMGQLTADRPATAYEGVALLHNGDTKKRWNGRGSYGIWRCNGTRGKKDRHPNEKPIDLCLKLVSLFSERGETIFDPFCGSGAIGEAALRLGRRYVGFDKDSSWVEKTMARLAGPLLDVTDEEALKLCTMPKVAEKAEEVL
jgi:hypothetical protein